MADGLRPGEARYRRLLIALFAAGFATFAQLSDVQAVLPALASDLQIDPATAALSVSATTLGVALSVLPWSVLSDRFGRVAVMKVSVVAAAALGITGPLVADFSSFLVVRLLLGIALGALPAISMAYLAEEIDRPHVTLTAGIFMAGNTIGALAGRLVAGPLAEVAGWRWAIEGVSILAVISAIAFLALIPKPSGFVRALPAVRRGWRTGFVARVLINLRDPAIRALYAQGALVMGLFAAIYNYIGFRLAGPPFNVSAEHASLIFLVILFGTIAAPVVGRFSERLGKLRVILVSLLVVVAGIGLTVASSLVAIIVGIAMFTMGSFVAHATASSWVGQRATIGRAQATASYQLFYQLGASLIGWGAGIVLQRFGWDIVAACLIVLATVAGIIAVVGLRGIRADPAPITLPSEGTP